MYWREQSMLCYNIIGKYHRLLNNIRPVYPFILREHNKTSTADISLQYLYNSIGIVVGSIVPVFRYTKYIFLLLYYVFRARFILLTSKTYKRTSQNHPLVAVLLLYYGCYLCIYLYYIY